MYLGTQDIHQSRNGTIGHIQLPYLDCRNGSLPHCQSRQLPDLRSSPSWWKEEANIHK